MPLDPKKLRAWFAILAIVLVAVVIGFYSYARYRFNKAIEQPLKKIGMEVTQSAERFTITKSEGGQKQFSISARKAVQFKAGKKSLQDVRIIVYGRGAKTPQEQRYDQIWGRQFEYDEDSGEVKATGEVVIDLEHSGEPSDDPKTVRAEAGSILLRTSGLAFNRNTGIAETREKIEFSIPQANGRALGARYDSKTRELTLVSEVRLHTTREAARQARVAVGPAEITATRAVITDAPRQAQLHGVRIEQAGKSFSADRADVYLKGDNLVDHMVADGHVTAQTPADRNSRATEIHAGHAVFNFGGASQLRDAVLSGNVDWKTSADQPSQGSAGRVILDFAERNRIRQVRAGEGVEFRQGEGQQASSIKSDAIDFSMTSGNLQRAVTSGPSQIVVGGSSSGRRGPTTITADRFVAEFTEGNRIRSVHGAPNARVSVPAAEAGKPERVTTSREVNATFGGGTKRNELTLVEQIGDFRYREGARVASADRARYAPGEDVINLSGSPRVDDRESGISITARTIRLNRRTSEASAEGDVKTTYSDMRAGTGAMLASGDPIHVTSPNAVATSSGSARFSGGARLWQGANLVEAPTIVFDRNRRWLEAQTGPSGSSVQTVFVQTDRSGKQVPVNITARHMTYSDPDRKAVFEGSVVAKSAGATMTGDVIEVLLKARSATGSAGSPSQVEQITARGNLLFDQQNPTRKAEGETLTYTVSDGKYVLYGTPEKPPSIFDAERGNITGESLTFYSHDDRVQVGSGQNSRTVTRTRIKEEPKP
ncbi:MAG: LPS export ABC transporter periplasmic protein LptC [Acidobacteriales bacterium]|nr:LPS export ABC transporter periplasmic protein LptC [Terriglobales bacterium]